MTLVSAPGEICHGRAFLVEPDVFEHLDHREKNGYARRDITLACRDGSTLDAVVYIAVEGNFAYLGPAPEAEIAEQIRHSVGPSGRNIDYVLELARALRELEMEDEHIFELERLLLAGEPVAN